MGSKYMLRFDKKKKTEMPQQSISSDGYSANWLQLGNDKDVENWVMNAHLKKVERQNCSIEKM